MNRLPGEGRPTPRRPAIYPERPAFKNPTAISARPGQKVNIAHLLPNPNFEFVRHDVIDPFKYEVDQIYNLACPASPPHYQYNSIKTIKTSVMGAINCLGLAKRVRARVFQASTSEVYGDPNVHPQPESYWGNVNPIGPRGVYDEAKRFAEAMTMAYHRAHGVDTRIARIFNTYGPRMRLDDGRVVPAFIGEALRGRPLTVFGDGRQTRSFCYVSDLIDGIYRLAMSKQSEPVNIGNPVEMTVLQFARVQTWVRPDGDKDRRLQALLRERLSERDGRLAFDWTPLPLGVVTWPPDALVPVD